MKLHSRVIRRIPPFRNLYHRLDALKKENDSLRKKLAASQKETEQRDKALEQQYKALEQRSKALEPQYKALEQQYKALEQQCNALKKQTDANEKHYKELAEKERKDCAALREGITSLNRTAAERDQKNFRKLDKQLGDCSLELNRKMDYYYMKGLEPSQYPDALKEWYYHKTGHELNLEHPRNYTEKIQWLKLYDSTPLKGKLADKYEVRDYVRERIGGGYLVPLLGVWDRVEDIPFDKLPERYVLKTTHGAGWNIIVQDKSQLDINDAKRKLKKWLELNFAFYAGLELHYRYIKPRVIAEEYMENRDGDIYDYKVLCFHGKARFILFLSQRKTGLKKAVYNREWKRMPFIDGGEGLEWEAPRPENLEKLISLAERLAEGFIHVRVDFYCLNGGEIRFGEMTFTPTSGRYLWEPEEYERMLGDMIHLPCDEEENQ